MPSIATTTLEQLEPLIIAKIRAIVPRIVVQGSKGWKYYAKARAATGRTREFTLRWVPGQFIPGGYFTTPGRGGVETGATLLVRTDYAGQHEKLQWLIQDDYAQLRDIINELTADSITTGLVSMLPAAANSARVADTNEGRQALSDKPVFNADAFQIDHTFALTYQQARAAS
jgi:hypothetical protein